jgi:predicted transcriptional regulator of viral defense system
MVKNAILHNVERGVEAAIRSKPKGALLFVGDFAECGSSEAVRQALVRLVKKGKVRRVSQGIYVRPRVNEFIGEVLPSAEEVALGIAKRDRAKIVPTGTQALNLLGLSTQVPLNLVYLTDGAPRVVRVGNRMIKFKKTTPKNLIAKGNTSRLVIQALRAVGRDNMTGELEEKILLILRKESQKNLRHDITLAPSWIREIMKKAL